MRSMLTSNKPRKGDSDVEEGEVIAMHSAFLDSNTCK